MSSIVSHKPGKMQSPYLSKVPTIARSSTPKTPKLSAKCKILFGFKDNNFKPLLFVSWMRVIGAKAIKKLIFLESSPL